MITKFVNGRQDNWDIHLQAYRTSPHKSTGQTPYKAMLGRPPPSKDGVATESIPMDEARKLISANPKVTPESSVHHRTRKKAKAVTAQEPWTSQYAKKGIPPQHLIESLSAQVKQHHFLMS